jgi:hypothetical protein
MRSMTPVELAVVIAVTGAVLAAGTPAFLRDLHASRMTEAVDGVSTIAKNAVAYSEDKALPASFPGPAPLTPSEVPRGRRVVDPAGTWDTPTWKALNFGFTSGHYYSFAFDVSGDPSRISFRAHAHGDLNGDGLTSTFAVEGERKPGQAAVVLPGMFVNREVE